MTKNTNNNNDKRVCLVFQHPEILHEFNNNIIQQYGQIKDHRIKVVEDLFTQYNNNRQLTQDKPRYIEENKQLLKANDDLNNKINQYKRDINELTLKLENKTTLIDSITNRNEDLTRNNEDLTTQINELNKILKSKDETIKNNSTLLNDKAVLEESIKNYKTTIDNMKKNHEETIIQYEATIDNLKKNNKETIIQYEATIKNLQQQITHVNKQLMEARTDYKTLVNTHKEDIKALNKEHDKKITSKDNTYRHLEERNEKLQDDYNKLQDTINKYSYAFGSINNLSLLNRILKNYPKEVKELSTGYNND